MPLHRSVSPPAVIVTAGLIAFVAPATAQPLPAQHEQVSIEDLINQDRTAEARERLEAARLEQGPNARILLLEAMLLHKEGSYQDSLRETQLALEADPRNAACHKLFGLNLVQLGRQDLAGEYFQAAAALDPQDHMAWYYLGLQQLNSRRPREALEAAQKAIELRPDYVDGYYVLGLVQEQLSNHAVALETYRRAAEMQLRQGLRRDTPYLYMGRLLLAQQRYDAAVDALKSAVQMNPEGHEAFTELGRALVETGRVEEALTPLLRAAKLEPLDERAHYQLMRAYKQLGREREARQAMETFRRLERTNGSGR